MGDKNFIGYTQNERIQIEILKTLEDILEILKCNSENKIKKENTVEVKPKTKRNKKNEV